MTNNHNRRDFITATLCAATLVGGASATGYSLRPEGKNQIGTPDEPIGTLAELLARFNIPAGTEMPDNPEDGALWFCTDRRPGYGGLHRYDASYDEWWLIAP